jgi:serine/threonine-protein kinase
MSLKAGARLGPYEITALLGAGGMGEVYRARDTRLNRDVALKVLPAALAADPERLARLTREAQLLASLNHQNIAAIHGLEDAGDTRALVLELVEGPTLADRIAQGAIPIDEALGIARQILDALEAAHEQGIVHRDLKPANIKVRADGMVKVLDFGLAKVLEPADAPNAAATMSPTLSMHATQAGLILGTAAYMSPEQAAGRPADKRSDIWSFGVVLMEMLTGGQAFTGETVPHVLAAVLKSDPVWSALPADTPPRVRRLLRRCLEKDRRRRLDSAVAARLDIDEAPASHDAGAVADTPRRAHVSFAAIGAAMAGGGVLAAALMWVLLRPVPSQPREPSRFEMAPGGVLRPHQFDRILTVSPGGRELIYVVQREEGTGPGGQLMIRRLDRLDPSPMPGLVNARSPFSSPDGQWVGFFEGTELKKAALAGGPAIPLCTFAGAPRGATWDDDGSVTFATNDPTTGLLRVSSGGGEPVTLTTPKTSDGEGDHWFPFTLPGGRGVLFSVIVPGQHERSEVAVYDANTRQHRTLFRGNQAQYVESGHLLYVAGNTLWAVRFDLTNLQVSGDPVPMLERVSVAPQSGAAAYQVSRAGTLAYIPSGPAPQRSLMWVDRSGREQPINAPPRAYALARLSPDGTRVALDIRDQENDIWILNPGSGTMQRLTSGPSLETNPVWVDDRRLVYSSNLSGRWAIYSQPADGSGSAQPLTESGNGKFATAVTPDRAAILGHQDGPSVFDLAMFPLVQPGQPPSPARELVKTPSFEHNVDISPNGRYLAYQSNESGPFQIIVRPFPQIEGGRWTISAEGGSSPLWSRDGKELFYRDGSEVLVAVPVETSGTTLSWGSPRRLFDIRAAATVPDRSYDVSLDGQRFLFIKEDTNTPPSDIVVVLDWLEELKAKVPAAP